MTAVLQGIRVLDFGRFIAGPCCSAILGDLGADVIRVERREGGEDRWLGPVGTTGEGGMFLQNNRNKRSLTLDMRAAEGAEIKDKLVRSADIVVVNLPQSMLEELGLGYDHLKRLNPRIVMTSISAFGNGGPNSERLGFDAVGQVMSGAVSRNGWPDQPVRTVVPYVDFSTALASGIGTLAALLHRNASGEGQLVEASLMCTAMMMTSAMMIEQDLLKPNRTAALNRGQLSAPNNIYPTQDGWIMMQVVGNPLFKRWTKLMKEPHWLEDPRFVDDTARGEHWEILDQRMTAWCAQRTRAAALEELAQARVPAYPVNTIQEALDDPHCNAMGYFKRTEYPGLAHAAPLVETPFRLSATPCEFRSRAPRVGEHTDEILQSIDYNREQISALRAKSVI